MTLLAVDSLAKSFGGVRALDDLSLSVAPGELVGVIGPNGAGKTTLFNCVSGVEPVDSGTVRFDGNDVTDEPIHAIAERGLVRTFQLTRELRTMTVTENVRLAASDHPGERTLPALLGSAGAREREREVAVRADALIERFELDHLREEYGGALSGGQRKLLELARTLMLDPKLLLLDEPFAGVNPSLTNDITEHVTALNDAGMTVVIIEHELETLLSLVDRLVVLEQGRLLIEGDPDAVVEDELVIEAYLGRS